MAQDIYLSEGKLVGPEGHVDISALANGTSVLNEADMASDSTTQAPSQASVVDYTAGRFSPLGFHARPLVNLGVPLPAASFEDAGAPTLDRLVFCPIPCPFPVAVDELAVRISTGEVNSTVRMGLYAPAANGRPGALLVDSGPVSAETSGVDALASLATPVNITDGLVWFAYVFQGAASTVRFRRYWWPASGQHGAVMLPTQRSLHMDGSGLTHQLGGVSGALPDPATFDSGGAHPNAQPRAWLRVSALL